MSRPLSARLALVLFACLLLPFGATAQPTGNGSAGVSNATRPWKPLSFHGDTAESSASIDAPLLAKRSGPVNVVIELADAPTAGVYAAAKSRGQAAQAGDVAKRQLAQIERAQQQLLGPLAQLNAKVIYRVQRVYNGIAAIVDVGKLSQIAKLPGVKALHPLISKQRENASSVPLIGAPEVWQSAGVTGSGVRIAIIDSGIDYIHTDFGGSGLEADYARNDTTVITETPALFPTAKVVTGYDFAGDDYDANTNPIPNPDPDPMDCPTSIGAVGHGTHVAGTAAGYGVNADGTTYTGAYDTSTPFSSLRIGPGVAPDASLFALRVFGCFGSTNLADEAIDWAVDPNGDGDPSDHVDVINMSLGSSFGGIYDSTSIASENAVAAGVIVVASAGNAGDTYYVNGSPGTAGSVISVAASADSTDITDGFRVNQPGGIAGVYPASKSALYDWENPPAPHTVPVTGTVVYPASNQTGCSAFTGADAALISGNIVLLDWVPPGASTFPCGSVGRTNNAEAAGAIGVIIADNQPFLSTAINGNASLPAVFTTVTVGNILKSQLTPGGASSVSATLTNEYANSTKLVVPQLTDTVAGFSSRGPRRGGVLKPDLAAPGLGTFSADAGSGNKGQTLNGTSMAAPHVAGSMALLKQIHSDWSPQQLKALAMNTATKDLRSDLPADAQTSDPARIGAGRIDVPNAAAQSTIAFDAANPQLVSLSFGNLEVTSTVSLERQVTIANKAASGSATFNLAYAPSVTIPGVSYTISPAQITVAAGATASVTVTMTANAALMRHTHAPTIAEVQVGEARHWVSEASGYLTMTPAAAVTNFSAAIHGYYENPPTGSSFSGTGVFTYTDSSNQLDYAIRFSTPITLTAGHIHRGVAGINGPVAYLITSGGSDISLLSGSATLSAGDEALLLSGGLYVNFHTTAFPGGEIRGQVVPAAPAERLSIYAAARPASEMQAQQSSLSLSGVGAPTATTVISLTGAGLNTGVNTPLDELSIVTAFELQHSSPQIVSTQYVTSAADLQDVGVATNFDSSGVVSTTEILFGLATYGNWSTPNAAQFFINIDTDRDGVANYLLSNSRLPSANDPTDVFVSRVCDLNTSTCQFEDYLNVAPAWFADTVPFNTSVIVIPVFAASLGLEDGQSRFNYWIDTSSFDTNDIINHTPILSYDVAAPGVSFTGGIADLPIFPDLPGTGITVNYNRNAMLSNGSEGVLLLHHHNASGARAEVVTTPTFIALPLVVK